MAKITTIPFTSPVPPELDEHRMIYNGDETLPPANEPLRMNRPVRRKPRSPIRPMVVLMIMSALIVLYIGNKISVNRLTREVGELQTQYQKMLTGNENLRAEITQKSRLERIEKIAVEELKMTYPTAQPVWFELDQTQVKRLTSE